MTTFDIIKDLCEKKGISIRKLEQDLGFGNGSIAKTNQKIQADRLRDIADYFGVSMDYLYPKKPGVYVQKKDGTEEFVGDFSKMHFYEDPATAEFMEFLHKNPEYSILFDASTKVKKEDIAKALRALGIFTED